MCLVEDALSPVRFDAHYLDRVPVVLTGASLCPPGVQLEDVEKCDRTPATARRGTGAARRREFRT